MIAVYGANETPIDGSHKTFLHELAMYTEASGVQYLSHRSVLDATLGAAYNTVCAQRPYMIGDAIGLTRNDEDLKTSFEAWAKDKTMEQVHSWDFATWLHDWAHDPSVYSRYAAHRIPC